MAKVCSVTQRIKEVTQPRGGYINPKSFHEIALRNDEKELHLMENINPGLVGTTVDSLSRYMVTSNAEDSFKISLLGAEVIHEEKQAYDLLHQIQGLDYNSIISAVRLTGYDVCMRASATAYKPVMKILPDKETVENIKIMVERSIAFFQQYGPVVLDGFTLEGGYTDTVNRGDGDFLTKDTLWDFKVLKSSPTKEHTLQLLMYWRMGLRSIHPEFQSIRYLGIYNPRQDTVYQLQVDSIPQEVLELVDTQVIGYPELNKKKESNKKSIYEQIKTLEQPVGGFINPKTIPYTVIPTKTVLHDIESIPSFELLELMKLLFQYKDMDCSVNVLYGVIKSIQNDSYFKMATSLIPNIKDLSDESIQKIYKVYKLSKENEEYLEINAIPSLEDKDLENIQVYLERYDEFLKKELSPIRHHVRYDASPNVESGYLETVTKDTLWNYSFSKKEPTKNQFLQLVVEYVIFIRTAGLQRIQNIGIYNPKLNTVYKMETENLDKDLLTMIEDCALGYKDQKLNGLFLNISGHQEYMNGFESGSNHSCNKSNLSAQRTNKTGEKKKHKKKKQEQSTPYGYYTPKKKKKFKGIKKIIGYLLFLGIMAFIVYVGVSFFQGPEFFKELFETQIQPVYESIVEFMNQGF